MSNNSNNEVVIVGAKRTAIGSFLGTISGLSASELGTVVLKNLIDECKLGATDVSEVILGQVLTAACGQNPARQTTINSGLDNSTPAMTINKVCGSGLKAVMLGAQSIKLGDGNIIIAGGQESMSQSPHAINIRQGQKMGDASMVDTMIKDGLWDAFNDYHMGTTAENIAKKYGFSREAQDEFASLSQNKAENAIINGAFNNEIVPVTIKSKKQEITFNEDEFVRKGTTVEALAKLRPAFDKEGTVTAGNASGINDGAAMLVLMTKQEAENRGLEILATINGYTSAGVDPQIMGTGPIPATQKLLKQLNWQVSDLDLVEANEAFAAQAMSVVKDLGLDISKVNVNGGAIALGHPIGASGARVLVTLIHALRNRGGGRGVATLCIGGGMGVALGITV